jgi:hypothetical protein
MQIYSDIPMVQLNSVSPIIFELLCKKGVYEMNLEFRSWDGSLFMLPGEPSIIHFPQTVACYWDNFLSRCALFKHLAISGNYGLFQGDKLASGPEFVTEIGLFIAYRKKWLRERN